MAEKEGELELWNQFQEPVDEYEERLFYHTFPQNGKNAFVELIQDRSCPETSPRVRLEFDPKELPNMVQWKKMQKQQYVVGLEPCNVLPVGRAKLRDEGRLPMLAPGEKQQITIKYEYIKP